MERRVFPEGNDPKGRRYDDLRWSRFKHFAPAEMLTVVAEHVFPFLRTDLAVLEGSATLRADDEEWRLEPGMLVRVGPGVKRKWVPGDEGATLLAIGATPGKAYVSR